MSLPRNTCRLPVNGFIDANGNIYDQDDEGNTTYIGKAPDPIWTAYNTASALPRSTFKNYLKAKSKFGVFSRSSLHFKENIILSD